jgi:hypothetical protein
VTERSTVPIRIGALAVLGVIIVLAVAMYMRGRAGDTGSYDDSPAAELGVRPDDRS